MAVVVLTGWLAGLLACSCHRKMQKKHTGTYCHLPIPSVCCLSDDPSEVYRTSQATNKNKDPESWETATFRPLVAADCLPA